MEDRGQWGSNLGFLFAAIGSAVGLGNIWRFPYMAYENGGGAFLFPYVVALFTAGIPILMLEFALGHLKVASAPKAFRIIDERWEWVGWWAVSFVMFGIVMYYIVIIGWCVNYVVFSVTEAWGSDPNAFFFGQFLQTTKGKSVWPVGAVNWRIAAGVAVVWFLNWFITFRGIEKGIEKAVKVMMPVLFGLTAVVIVWSLFLDGAGTGIRHYVKPSFEKITNKDVWVAAYGQIFFSLSLGFGIMIAYASYLPRRANIFKNALIVGFSNSLYEVSAGFGVFSILGYMALQQHKALSEVVDSGIGLAFVAYPKAISLLPGGRVFGVLFFFLLVIAGVSSSISIIEAFTAAIIDKFTASRQVVISVICAIGFVGSLVFTTRAGLWWLDIVDHFLNQYGLLTVGIVEALIVGWLYRTDKLKMHIVSQLGLTGRRHKVFNYIILRLWMYCIRFVTPVALGIAIVTSLLDEFTKPYGGYAISAIIVLGVGWLLVTHVFAFGISGLPWKRALEADTQRTGSA
jgi:NSS family neurotransmitter:Na+ symporter